MADTLGKKISELAETTDLAGLYTIGSDKDNQSKKVSLQFVKEAADYANAQGDYAKTVGDTVAGNVGVDEYPAFSESKQYAAGDVVNYNGKLYRFTSVHAAGAWVGTDAIETSIKAETDVKLTELEQEVIYDVTANNNGVTFVSLSALLSDENLSTLIPSTVRCGGMSIRFVQSSDNKYVQYRLMDDEWSTNTDNWAIADEGVNVDNPEFVYVKTDAEDKILWAIKADGSIYYGAGVPQQVKDYINEKIADLSLDEYEDIVAFLADLEQGDKTLQQLLNEKLDADGLDADALGTLEVIENPEWTDVKTDLDDNEKILEGTKKDGTKVIAGNTQIGGNAAIDGNVTILGDADINGTTVKNITDPEERMEVKTDRNGRILSYRNKEGVLHENVGVFTNHLSLSQNGMNEFIQSLKNAGFNPGGTGDWSEYLSNDGDKPLCISIPRCAALNIISNTDLTQIRKATTAGAVEGVNYDIPTQIEFYDMQGNYFKKWTLMSGQGTSSMAYPKRNIALDFFDSEVDGDAFAIKFGDWVPQDSYHLKAYYTDAFRCIGLGSYKLYDSIVKTRGVDNDYIYKRTLVDFSKIGYASNGFNDIDNISLQYETGAKCFPDGFPVVVYQNGRFWGLFCWQIKKHRDNYHMSKKSAKNIHLDGKINNSTLLGGNIDWDANTGFEVRNPKDLYLMDGTKYDADFNSGELIDNTSQYYDSENANHVRSAQVKQYIIALSNVYTTLNNAEVVYNESSKTAEDLATLKAVIETYFDIDNLIDYLIMSDISRNYDGFSKNWQWLTYNGVKWYIGLYDCDGCFGGNFTGTSIIVPLPGHHITTSGAFHFILAYYSTELKERYAYLRNNNVIDADKIIDIFRNILLSFGEKNIEKEFDRWVDCPCNRDTIVNENWEFDLDENGNPQMTNPEDPNMYDNATTYNAGDSCYYAQYPFNGEAIYKYKATNTVTGVKPVDQFGYRDSIYRLYNWIKTSISNMDSLYQYNNN